MKKLKSLFMALLAFFGLGQATAQEPPKSKQKPKTVTDTPKTKRTHKGGVKRIDTTATQPLDRKMNKARSLKDSVSVKNKK